MAQTVAEWELGMPPAPHIRSGDKAVEDEKVQDHLDKLRQKRTAQRRYQHVVPPQRSMQQWHGILTSLLAKLQGRLAAHASFALRSCQQAQEILPAAPSPSSAASAAAL